MLRKIIIAALFALGIYSYYTTNKLIKTEKKLDRIENNLAYYLSLTSTSNEENKVLKMTIDELLNTNDSILTKLEDTRDMLNIKDKQLKSEAYVKTVIKDSIQTIVKELDFTSLLVLNGLTNVTVSKKDSVLNVKLDITNELFLYVKRRRVYKNKYKNGWLRFWHFDWKKIDSTEYEIYNSNPIIKVKLTRVVEL